jgi:hypothetical protein
VRNVAKLRNLDMVPVVCGAQRVYEQTAVGKTNHGRPGSDLNPTRHRELVIDDPQVFVKLSKHALFLQLIP